MFSTQIVIFNTRIIVSLLFGFYPFKRSMSLWEHDQYINEKIQCDKLNEEQAIINKIPIEILSSSSLY